MSPLSAAVVRSRRLLARHPALQWVAIAGCAIAAAATVHDHTRRVDAAREAWGTSVDVWVAREPLEPGDLVVADRRPYPEAVVPPGAIDDPRGLVATQRIAVGDPLSSVDVARAGPLALVPAGWVVVPVIELTPSGVSVGDHVVVVGDGVEVTDDAVVVGAVDDAVLLGVPRSAAAVVVGAADAVGVTLVRRP